MVCEVVVVVIVVVDDEMWFGLLVRYGCGEKLFFLGGGRIVRIEERGERRE